MSAKIDRDYIHGKLSDIADEFGIAMTDDTLNRLADHIVTVFVENREYDAEDAAEDAQADYDWHINQKIDEARGK